jgi:hypothetical protein
LYFTIEQASWEGFYTNKSGGAGCGTGLNTKTGTMPGANNLITFYLAAF